MRIFIFLSFFTILFSSCNLPILPSDSQEIVETTQSGTLSYQASLDPEVRLSLAKKRKSYISGIRKGDFYSLQNAPEEALSYYLQIQEKIPDDQVVRKKIAHVYFLLKDWKNSYGQYVQVPFTELTKSEKDELYRSLFFDADRTDRLTELARLPEDPIQDYYRNIDVCYTGIHNCIIGIQGYTGSEDRIQDIRLQIQNAPKISEDYQYRNLLVAAKFYEQGMYRVSSKIAHEILENRPDYTEAKKIEAFSLYELGEYDPAKKLLLQYLEKNPNDLESIVRIGELSFQLGDYSTSNLYINNAILAGYTPKIDLERRLIFNYSLLGDTAGAMKVFGYLLQEADLSEDDFAVGISFALEQGQNEKAKSWAVEGLRAFPNSPITQPLY
ncbi:hypothetical protein KBB25_03850, partial [Candidatus Gracilibacteria bacterium]|nr:hypothetical protein [Candidatus Gracilibacteria bacterium]